jgi:signal transduction histidine kinase
MVDQTYEEQLKSANEIVYKHSLELARLKQELELLNSQQEALLHFISHEIKGYLTKGQNAFAAIIEGDYGVAPTGIQALSTGALHEMRKGVSTVMDILDASNYKKGTMTFDKKRFDIKKTILEMTDELRFMAEEKNLQFAVQIAPAGDFYVLGDEQKLRRHVFRNLIENSIRYTPSGKVQVALSHVEDKIRLTVSDTGVGISEEDKKRLFTQGGRGKDSVKVNVDSTGYGLFVAKMVTDAHNGSISAFSEGPGKGATFSVDLPSA